MKHFVLPRFWQHYRLLPEEIRKLADKNFGLLNSDPHHPKRVGKAKQLWSVRIGMHYRALATEKPEGLVWFWIGTHAEYDKLLS